MRLLYNIGIRLYFLAVWLASFFNTKANLWIAGRKSRPLIRFEDSIWFHFASLGEFEQGRPVLEELRRLNPQHKVVITFFSPSGYEIRKDTPLADAVYYLPLDTANNARNFIETLQPKMAVFTKYEYWYHYFNELDKRNIPLYMISGIFRPGQVFFKWYGGLHRRMLGFVTYFFVQDERSEKLLKKLGIDKVTISGDTRFDRVWANAQLPKNIPQLSNFKNGQKLFVAGSTWPADEGLLAELVKSYPGWKFIFAPHEVGEDKVANLINLLPKESVERYSQISNLTSQISHLHILIIDSIGLLSSLYQYGDIAYIGGGFGAGIHNTLEAAAFGLPVIFGPEYARFREAHELIGLKAGFSIMDENGLKETMDMLANNEQLRITAGRKAKDYVRENTGATKTIISYISKQQNLTA